MGQSAPRDGRADALRSTLLALRPSAVSLINGAHHLRVLRSPRRRPNATNSLRSTLLKLSRRLESPCSWAIRQRRLERLIARPDATFAIG